MNSFVKTLIVSLMIFSSLNVYSADLVIDTVDSSLASGTYSFDTVLVKNNHVLLCKGNTGLNTGVVITCTNVIIEAGSRISADSQGYPKGQGPGTPIWGLAGAGYGGYGGPEYWPPSVPTLCGFTYGSIKNPTDLGSGGGTSNPSSANGGGCIVLNVAEEIRIDGILSANAQDTSDGGASGGTVNIRTKTLSGSGQILANGGNSLTGNTWGVGGGGRIAVYYDTYSFTGSILARRGQYQMYGTGGGCGTIFLKPSSQPNGDLILDGGGYASGYYTPVSGSLAFDTIVVKNSGHSEITSGSVIQASNIFSANTNATLKCNGTILNSDTLTIGDTAIVEINVPTTFNNVWIKPSGRLSHTANYDAQKRYTLSLTVNNDITIETGGYIDLKGKGYPGGYGPGIGTGSYGGSYGGKGCTNSAGSFPGVTYGSETAPYDLGSGGNQGPGGGAIYLLVWGTLRLDGTINAESANYDWAGSGGSIYIKAIDITGDNTGKITVAAGGGPSYWLGGGGRIAVYYSTLDCTVTYDTRGAQGSSDSMVRRLGTGTLYLKQTNFHLPPGIPAIDNPSYSSPIPGKRPTFKWSAPRDEEGDTLQFKIEVTQDSSFTSTPTLTALSSDSIAGFQYSTNSGITWQDFPSVGVMSNRNPAVKVSYACQSDLWVGTWYWRVHAIDRDGNGNWSECGYLPSIIGDLVVRITSPADSATTYDEKITVKGIIEQSITRSININGASQNLSLTDNKFSIEADMEIGKNTIVVTGNGTLGNYISDTIDIYRLKVPVTTTEVNIGASGGEIAIEDWDGDKTNDSRIEFEQGTFDKEVKIKFVQLNGELVPTYELKIEEQDGYLLKKRMKLILSYRNLKVESGDEDKLTIHYWDTVKWVPIGSEVNKEKRVVSCYTKHTSKYAIMLLPESKDVVVNVTPVIITPNRDGINDAVTFNIILKGNSKAEISIYDSSGRPVRNITEDNISAGLSTYWDGLDVNGKLVETGLYLYNVIISGKIVSSGSILIAK